MAKKVSKTVTLNKEILEWVELEIKKHRFSSLSHAAEYALYHLRDSEKV